MKLYNILLQYIVFRKINIKKDLKGIKDIQNKNKKDKRKKKDKRV